MSATALGVKALIERSGRYLILAKHTGEMDLPGGRVESGETLETALMREIAEETGLSVKINDIIRQWSFEKSSSQTILGCTYHCAWTGGLLEISPEHQSGFWLPAQEFVRLLGGLFPSQRSYLDPESMTSIRAFG